MYECMYGTCTCTGEALPTGNTETADNGLQIRMHCTCTYIHVHTRSHQKGKTLGYSWGQVRILHHMEQRAEILCKVLTGE